MSSIKKPYVFTRGKILFDLSSIYCDSPATLLQSDLFLEVAGRFLERIASRESRIYTYIRENVPLKKRDDLALYIVKLFRLLVSHTSGEIIVMNSEYFELLAEREYLLEFVEELYNFWRRFERFLYVEAPKRSRYTTNSIHHAQFIKLSTELKALVLDTYRHIRENLTGKNPRSYRQLPAGANMGMLLEKVDWKCPDFYSRIKDIPFIRLTIMESPLILYPKMNTRKGSFTEIYEINEDMLLLIKEHWFCYPAKIGTLTAFIYFHQDFVSQGLSMCNLFEIADYEEIENSTPDMILFFGLKNVNFPGDTVFYDDRQSGMLVGLVRHSEEIDYFGYFKKMPLTFHNIVMLRRGRLPLHGAMTYLTLKNGGTAGVVIVGDSGAGKSETIEAFRILAEEHIRDVRIIFDDMGSINIDDEGRILGYGTEIGAFVRLDDLQPGYAYEEIDRSIFMNPNRTNARLIIPITSYYHITKGYDVNLILYANNYEQVDQEHAAIEFFDTPEDAIAVFRSGARLAKGTTDEKGIVHTYFANPFGAPQRKQEHEERAQSMFAALFAKGVKVGQCRTRLAIEGFEQEGPRVAALELFNVIQKMSIDTPYG